MSLPSITVILGAIFMIYVSYSVFTLSQLFTSLQCTSTPCYTTILAKLPKLQLNLFVSPINNPMTKDVTKIGAITNFDYYKELKRLVHLVILIIKLYLDTFIYLFYTFKQRVYRGYPDKNLQEWHNVSSYGFG